MGRVGPWATDMSFIRTLQRLVFGSNGTPSSKKEEVTAPEQNSPPPPEPMLVIPPPAEDQSHLEQYEGKLQLVRDYVRGVALGYSAGFYLHGAGGISKSFTVLGELERLG